MASIYSNILYDDVPPPTSGGEEMYKVLWTTLYETGIVSKIMLENIKKEEVGTESNFLELYYLSKFIRYLTLYQLDINNNVCNEAYLEELKASYKLKCIRQTMFCKYGLDKIFDKLIALISQPTNLGIGGMGITVRCNPFTVN
jgi:hypothetical protein